jgi:hypothetical protein
MFWKSILAAAIGVTIVGANARAEAPGVTNAEVKVGLRSRLVVRRRRSAILERA